MAAGAAEDQPLSRRLAATALAFILAAAVAMPAGAATAESQYLLAVETLEREGFPGIDGALKSFEEVISRDESFLPAYLSAAEACLLKYEFNEPRDTRWLEKALVHLEGALTRDPKIPEAYFKRAVVRFNRGEEEAAVADLDKALELDPAYLDARLLTLQHLLTSGEKKSARAFADASREYYPGDPGPLKYLADVFFQEGSLDDAIDYYRDVTGLVAQWYSGALDDNQGMVLFGDTSQTAGLYWSSEHPTQELRPQLVIDYTPEPATMSLLALGGLALIRRRRA